MLHAEEILPDIWEQIENQLQNHGDLIGLSSGFYDLDNYTSGLQDANLIILGGRPSMGKTAFASNIATHIAIHEQKPVLFFSLEMTQNQLMQRMLCAEAEIDAQRIKLGALSEQDFPKLTRGVGSLGAAPIFIDDTPGITDIESIVEKLYKMHEKLDQNLGIVIIDYLQLIGSKKSISAEYRAQELSVMSRRLKSLTKELKIPILVLSQLSRFVESRLDKKPVLYDLRDSGSLEDDADLVMFIYRDEYYNKDSERPGWADIIIAKHRHGAIGEFSLLFRNSVTRFLNPADRKVQIF